MGSEMCIRDSLVSSRFPAFRERLYVPEAAVDKFAVAVSCKDAEGYRRAEEIMRGAGAEEIRELEGAD